MLATQQFASMASASQQSRGEQAESEPASPRSTKFATTELRNSQCHGPIMHSKHRRLVSLRTINRIFIAFRNYCVPLEGIRASGYSILFFSSLRRGVCSFPRVFSCRVAYFRLFRGVFISFLFLPPFRHVSFLSLLSL